MNSFPPSEINSNEGYQIDEEGQSTLLTENPSLRKRARSFQTQEKRSPAVPTIRERWESFKETRTWKLTSPLLRPIPALLILLSIGFIYLVFDFQVVTNGEAYSPKSKCTYPLVLFKDSALKYRNKADFVKTDPPDFFMLNDLLTTSTCYLKNYMSNVTCITPIAYGHDYRIISLRRKNGDIIHLINPSNPRKSERKARITETNTLLPDKPSASVKRPLTITLEYLDGELKNTKSGTFEYEDSFCIDSSLDLFDFLIPQISNESSSEEKTK